MKVRAKAGTWALVCAIALGTGCKPQVSDTGYVGTWGRDVGKARSSIGIARDGSAYRFLWKVDSSDGHWRVRCNATGQCEEFVDGEKASDYVFTTRLDPQTQHLVVECNGQVHRPKKAVIHYEDEMVVEPGGRTLTAYTRLRQGERYEGNARPKHTFEKISDEPLTP